MSHKNMYTIHPFTGEDAKPFVIDANVKVIATPGHTLDSVSVIVNNCTSGFGHLEDMVLWSYGLGLSVVAVIAGDLFEKEEDIHDDSVWIEAGSEDQAKQRESRAAVLALADWVVPGHGPPFKVNRE